MKGVITYNIKYYRELEVLDKEETKTIEFNIVDKNVPVSNDSDTPESGDDEDNNNVFT